MIKVEHIETFNFEGAIRGLRNPMNSWDKSDSEYKVVHVDQFSLEETKEFVIGSNDLDLMKRLYKAGPEHRKYLRQIFVSMDITAPLYWWKEMDQYRINVTTNSCSTMHRLTEKPFQISDFSHEHLMDTGMWLLEATIDRLNKWRSVYVLGNQVYEPKNKDIWWQMIQLLPSSYNQRRTITMNYENVVTMIRQRTNHKLDEWNEFVAKLKELPYIKEIIGEAV